MREHDDHEDREGQPPGEERESPVASAPGEDSGADEGEPKPGGDASSDEAGWSRRDAWEKGISEFQDVVSDILGSIRNIPAVGGRYPRHDLVRVPGEGYWVFMDLPGVEKDDIEVTTEGDDLMVVGERRRPELPEESEVLGSGRDYGGFRREIQMPTDVDHSRIRAKLEQGVLKLVLPRRREAERTRVEIEE